MKTSTHNSKNMISLIEDHRFLLIKENKEIHVELDKERSRLVWFVAISGFAIVNNSDLPSILHENISLLPWAISATFAILGHISSDKLTVITENYFSQKYLLLGLQLNKAKHGDFLKAEMDSLLDNTEPRIKRFLDAQKRLLSISNALSLISYLSLLAAFLFAIFSPFS